MEKYLTPPKGFDEYFKTTFQLNFREWAEGMPFIRFDPEWEVSIIPPFGGALARFFVRNRDGSGWVSVYFDGYGALGCMTYPYWEIFPYDDDVCRFKKDDVEGLTEGIRYSLRQQAEEKVAPDEPS